MVISIDGVNVAECNSFLNEYEFPNNLEGGYYKEKNLCECGVQGTESYPFFCKDNPDCYFKQLQRAKVELEQYKKSKQASYEAMQKEWNNAVNELRELKATDKIEFKQYYKAENERLKAENEKLKEKNKSIAKDYVDVFNDYQKYKQALEEVREWLLKWQFNANIIKHTNEPLNKINEVLENE